MNGRNARTGVAVAGLMLTLAGTLPVTAEVRESRTIRESFDLSSGGRVIVDNVWGSIEVEGTSGNKVELVVEEVVIAKDAEALKRAREEVRLEIESDASLVDLYVDGPFRDRNERNGWSRNHWRPRYEIRYEFSLRVPSGIAIELKTVTDGEIRVAGVRGDFDVSNVNGGIEMRGLAGSGEVSTVNGPITLDFVASPQGASSFSTVNGDVEVYFPGDLSADLQMTSRFGDLWSEIEVESLPTEPAVRETRDGRTIIKTEGSLVRIAAGGPRLSFETLNGDVLIRKHSKGGTR
jgi:hypothetical protein